MGSLISVFACHFIFLNVEPRLEALIWGSGFVRSSTLLCWGNKEGSGRQVLTSPPLSTSPKPGPRAAEGWVRAGWGLSYADDMLRLLSLNCIPSHSYVEVQASEYDLLWNQDLSR